MGASTRRVVDGDPWLFSIDHWAEMSADLPQSLSPGGARPATCSCATHLGVRGFAAPPTVSLVALVLCALGAAALQFARPEQNRPTGKVETADERDEQGALRVRRQVIHADDGYVLNHGPLYVWWPSGSIRSIGNWRFGRKHGPFTHWHADGRLAKETSYRDGLLEGGLRTWDESGRLTRDLQYHRGRLAH